MSEIYGVLVVIAWFVSAIVGALIGMQKGKAGKGALLGFFFGPLGWIMMMFDIGMGAFLFIVVLLISVGAFLIYAAVQIENQRAAEFKAEMEKRDREEQAREQRLHDEQVAAIQTAANPEPVPADEPAPTPAPTPMIKPIFPPGVDTPEQRRAYLQALAEAKKKAPQQPVRTSSGVRGY